MYNAIQSLSCSKLQLPVKSRIPELLVAGLRRPTRRFAALVRHITPYATATWIPLSVFIHILMHKSTWIHR